MSEVKRKSLMESICAIAGVSSPKQIKEGRMAEVDQILQDVASGELDAYTVMNHPTSPEEQYAAQQLQQMYDTVAQDRGLHADDQFEEILDIVCDQLAQQYGITEGSTSKEKQVKPYKTMAQHKEAGEKYCADVEAAQKKTQADKIGKKTRSKEVREMMIAAGLPLVEGWDDDDDDADVRAAERELKKVDKKNPKAAAAGKQAEAAAKKVDADKDLSKLAKKSKADDEEDETPEKKEAPAAEKKEAPKAEKAASAEKKEDAGSTPASDAKFAAVARKFLANNPNASAADVRAHCVKGGCTPPAHFHSRLSGIKASIKKSMLKKGVKEGYILIHPQMPSFVLAENQAMNQYQWISMKDEQTSLEPMMFESEADAKKIMTYVREYKNQACVLTPVKLED